MKQELLLYCALHSGTWVAAETHYHWGYTAPVLYPAFWVLSFNADMTYLPCEHASSTFWLWDPGDCCTLSFQSSCLSCILPHQGLSDYCMPYIPRPWLHGYSTHACVSFTGPIDITSISMLLSEQCKNSFMLLSPHHWLHCYSEYMCLTVSESSPTPWIPIPQWLCPFRCLTW